MMPSVAPNDSQAPTSMTHERIGGRRRSATSAEQMSARGTQAERGSSAR